MDIKYNLNQYDKGFQDAKNKYYKRGEWVQTSERDEYGRIICECSNCNYKIKLIVTNTNSQNYCPCCGAKMYNNK